MSFNSAPSSGNNEKKIVEIHTPDIATDAPKRKREFDILRTALKKNPPKVAVVWAPRQELNAQTPLELENSAIEDMLDDDFVEPSEQDKDEIRKAIYEDDPKLQQLLDEERQKILLEKILKKKWLELLKESTRIDEATIQQNNDLIVYLRGKDDSTSKKMLSELLLSNQVSKRMIALNKAEIATATSDTSYWEDAYRKPQLEQPKESDIDQQKLSAEALLGRVRKSILTLKNNVKHLTSLDQSDEGVSDAIKSNKAILKQLQVLVATEEAMLHPRKPYDQIYIGGAKIRNGEIPVQRGEWEDTKMPETT